MKAVTVAMFLALLTISITVSRQGMLVRDENFLGTGFEIKIAHPPLARPGEVFTYNFTIITNRTLTFTVNVTVIGTYPLRHYRIYNRTLLAGRSLKAHSSLTVSDSFLIPISVGSGPLIFVVEIAFASENDYETVNGVVGPAHRMAVIIGPYISAYERRTIRECNEIMAKYEYLKYKVKELNCIIGRLNYYLSLWKEEYRRLLKKYLTLHSTIKAKG
ncbi:MAG: hypothetical protein B6U69_01905 [Thermofilum sp. ex4484_15]|nr:MAG: hypothetical protein B6U69_01905 [Thermofilum sp. ex4484_15]